MKILLANSKGPLPLHLHIEYCSKKGVNFYVYRYDIDKDRLIKENPPYKNIVSGSMGFISGIDLGKIYSTDIMPIIQGFYFHKLMDFLRFDEHLISLVEEYPFKYSRYFTLRDVEAGKFRVVSCKNSGEETIEFEKDIKWIEPKQKEVSQTKRFVLKLSENTFVKHIHWIAGGVIPNSITIGSFDDALILTGEYLEFINDRVGKSRKELICEKFSEIKIIPVEVALKNL